MAPLAFGNGKLAITQIRVSRARRALERIEERKEKAEARAAAEAEAKEAAAEAKKAAAAAAKEAAEAPAAEEAPAAAEAPAEEAAADAPAADADTGAKKYTKTELTKMLEVDVVAIANEMGIEATVDDLKADTIQKVLDKQG